MAYNGRYSIAIRILLLKKYLEANAGRNRYVSRGDMEELLRKHELSVEKKALYADLAILGDVFGLQLEYDTHRKAYRLLNPPFEPHELRLMVDGIQSSKFITRKKSEELILFYEKKLGLASHRDRLIEFIPSLKEIINLLGTEDKNKYGKSINTLSEIISTIERQE